MAQCFGEETAQSGKSEDILNEFALINLSTGYLLRKFFVFGAHFAPRKSLNHRFAQSLGFLHFDTAGKRKKNGNAHFFRCGGYLFFFLLDIFLLTMIPFSNARQGFPIFLTARTIFSAAYNDIISPDVTI